MDAEDNMDAPSGSKRGRMSIRIEEANETSDSLETEDNDSNEEAIPKELKDFSLPAEVWIHAWSFWISTHVKKYAPLFPKHG